MYMYINMHIGHHVCHGFYLALYVHVLTHTHTHTQTPRIFLRPTLRLHLLEGDSMCTCAYIQMFNDDDDCLYSLKK